MDFTRPEDVAQEFMDSWNRHDMAAFAALFAEDANFVNVVGTWWTSRKEIEAAHAVTHATIFRQSRLAGEAAVTPLARGLVAMHVKWELTGLVMPNGAGGGRREGILLLILEERRGRFWIRIAQNTDIVPGAAAPPATNS